MSIYGKIQELENKIDVVEAKANGQINNFTFTNVNATSVNVTSVTSSGGNFSSVLTASHLTGSQLTSSFANINQLTASNALISNKLICSGNISFASGFGIDFAANASAAGVTSESFNDYEEGTWTPTYISSGGGSVTYGTGVKGFYTKVGRVVFINCYLATNSVASLNSGDISLGGLPFNKNVDASNLPTFTTYFQDFNTSLIDIKADFVLNDRISLYAVSGSSTAFERLKRSNMSTNTNGNLLELSGFYIV